MIDNNSVGLCKMGNMSHDEKDGCPNTEPLLLNSEKGTAHIVNEGISQRFDDINPRFHTRLRTPRT